MANAFFDKGREKFLKGAIDVSSDDIIVMLVDSGYTPNLSTDEFISDVTGGNGILARSSPLSSITTAAGVFDAADELLASVPAVGTGTYLILAKDTGTDSTSPLIGKIDTGTNLPVTPNGGDINIAWSNGSSKIFKL